MNKDIIINMASATTKAFEHDPVRRTGVPCPAIEIEQGTLTITQGIISCYTDGKNLNEPVIRVGERAKLIMNGGIVKAYGNISGIFYNAPGSVQTATTPVACNTDWTVNSGRSILDLDAGVSSGGLDFGTEAGCEATAALWTKRTGVSVRGDGSVIDASQADSVRLLGGLVSGGVSRGPVIILGGGSRTVVSGNVGWEYPTNANLETQLNVGNKVHTVFEMSGTAIVRDSAGVRNGVRYSGNIGGGAIVSASNMKNAIRILGGSVIVSGDSSAIMYTGQPSRESVGSQPKFQQVGVHIAAGTITAANGIAVNAILNNNVDPFSAGYPSRGIVRLGSQGGAGALTIEGRRAAVNARQVEVFAPSAGAAMTIRGLHTTVGSSGIALSVDSVVVNARLVGAGTINVRGSTNAILARGGHTLAGVSDEQFASNCDPNGLNPTSGSQRCANYPIRFIANEGQNPWNNTSIQLALLDTLGGTAGVGGDVVKVETRGASAVAPSGWSGRTHGILIQNAGVNMALSGARMPQNFLYSDSNVVVLNGTVSVPATATTNTVAIRALGDVSVTLDPTIATLSGRSASVTSGNASAIIAEGNVKLSGATIQSNISAKVDGNSATVESTDGYIAVLPTRSRVTTVINPGASAGISDAVFRTRGLGKRVRGGIGAVATSTFRTLTSAVDGLEYDYTINPVIGFADDNFAIDDKSMVGVHDVMIMGSCSLYIGGAATVVAASMNFYNTVDGLPPNNYIADDGKSHLYSKEGINGAPCYSVGVNGCNNAFNGGGVYVRIAAGTITGTQPNARAIRSGYLDPNGVYQHGDVGIFNENFRAEASTGNVIVVNRKLEIFDADSIRNTGISFNADAAAIRLLIVPALNTEEPEYHVIKGKAGIRSALGAALWNSGTHGIVIGESSDKDWITNDGMENTVKGAGFGTSSACDAATPNMIAADGEAAVNCARKGLIFTASNTPGLFTTGSVAATLVNQFGVITSNGNVRVNAGSIIRSSNAAAGIKLNNTGAGLSIAHVQVAGGFIRSQAGSAIDASASRISIFGGEIIAAGPQPTINLPFKNTQESDMKSGVYISAASHSLVSTWIRAEGTASAIVVGPDIPVDVYASGDQSRVEISAAGVSAKGILAKTGDVRVVGLASTSTGKPNDETGRGAKILVLGNGGTTINTDAALYTSAAAGIGTEGGDVLLKDAFIEVRGAPTGTGPTKNSYGIITMAGGDIYVVTSEGRGEGIPGRTVIKAAGSGAGIRAIGENSVVWVGNNPSGTWKGTGFTETRTDNEVIIETTAGTAVRTDRGGVGVYQNAFVTSTVDTTIHASDSVNVYGIVEAVGVVALDPKNNAIVAKRARVIGNVSDLETPVTRGFVFAGSRSAAFVNAGEATSVSNAIRITGNSVADSVYVINGGRITAYGAGKGVVTHSATSVARVVVGNGDNENEIYGIVEAGTGGRAIEIGAGDVFVSVPGTHVRILGQRSAGNTITTAGNVSVTGGR
ncbi:MAG: hypothetical protein FWC23_10605, partial [Chitinispirillia bacterium]|nr:hypothetical protein [Chitinispirillia bacterium]